MSPQQAITWTDAAQKVVIPLLLGMLTSVGGWTAAELRNMNNEIQQLKIRVAELSVELKMYSQQPRGN
jgi:hypothetical protein